MVMSRFALVSGRYKKRLNFKTENIEMNKQSLHTLLFVQQSLGGERVITSLSEKNGYFGKNILAHLNENPRYFFPPKNS